MTGKVINISRFRMAQDGEGVSTLVTLFGCPLHCQYCINPFCNKNDTPITYYTPEHLVETLRKDDLYFKMTGGGIVFGGGEPLIQADFVYEACQNADPLWKKRVETSLHVKWESIEILTNIIDEWIIDVKDMNPKIYKRYTGNSNWLVIRNLQKLAELVPKEKIWLRVPLIAGMNTKEDIKKSVAMLKEMGFSRIEEFEYIKKNATNELTYETRKSIKEENSTKISAEEVRMKKVPISEEGFLRKIEKMYNEYVIEDICCHMAPNFRYNSFWELSEITSAREYVDYITREILSFKKTNTITKTRMMYFRKSEFRPLLKNYRQRTKPCLLLEQEQGEEPVCIFVECSDGLITRMDVMPGGFYTLIN